MNIAFVWQGITEAEPRWRDGLYWAMKEIEKKHSVSYFEPWGDIQGDVVLYWEAPCTANGVNASYYDRVRRLPIRKALLFAGGPIVKNWVDGFDHAFVESKINKDEFDSINVPNSVAFGVNADVFKPINQDKIYQGIHHGTSASWKRQWLMAEALGSNALVVGRHQKEDPYPFDRSRELGATVLHEQPAGKINQLLNQSICLVQTSEFWGGGQRATLEALSAGIPVVCMTDSPKNREYVEESGAGLVVDPDVHRIREAVQEVTKWERPCKKGRDYVLSKWTHQHYANNLLNWIEL